MIYLEIYAEHGVGWRIPIPDSAISPAKKGKMTISGLTLPIDESCTLMRQFAIVTDANGVLETIMTGELTLGSQHISCGDIVRIDNITLGIS